MNNFADRLNKPFQKRAFRFITDVDSKSESSSSSEEEEREEGTNLKSKNKF